MDNLAIYCVDIGSVKAGSFGWAKWDNRSKLAESAIDPCDLVQRVTVDLLADIPVALGFECPIFAPLRDDPAELSRARGCEVFRNRKGDRTSRPWSAGAGCAVLATGLPQVVWILKAIRAGLVDKEVPAFLRWNDFQSSGRGLFLWEAFVTSDAKTESHGRDAGAAVACFARALPNIDDADVNTDTAVHCLVGAALLRTGWSTDLSLLSTPCVVIRA